MAGETKYISRYTGAQIDEALGLLFTGESTRNAAYEAAEAERDTQFESKEATRDEANRAALDAAEAIAELQRQARGRVTDIDSLHNITDLGTYHYIGSGWKGLVNVNFDASSKVSQVALSSSTPFYENDSLTWLSGKPCVMVRTYTNGAWSAWSKAGADVVNDLVTGGTDKALSAEQGKVLDEKVAALGPKCDQINGKAEIIVDFEEYSDQNGWLRTDGTFYVPGSSVEGFTYKVIPVVVGRTYMLRANIAESSLYALVKDFTQPSNNDVPNFCTQYEQVYSIRKGVSVEIVIPSDCKYIIVDTAYNSTDRTPYELLSKGTNGAIADIQSQIDEINGGSMIDEIAQEYITSVKRYMAVASGGAFTGSGTYYIGFYPIKSGSKISVFVPMGGNSAGYILGYTDVTGDDLTNEQVTELTDTVGSNGASYWTYTINSAANHKYLAICYDVAYGEPIVKEEYTAQPKYATQEDVEAVDAKFDNVLVQVQASNTKEGYYINKNNNTATSGSSSSALAFYEVKGGDTYHVSIPKTGNTATVVLSYAQEILQSGDVAPEVLAYIGDSAAFEMDIVALDYKYLIVDYAYASGLPTISRSKKPFATTEDFETIEDKLEDEETFNILCFGNSFSQDSMGYAPILLTNLAPNLKVRIALACIGGCTMAQHCANLTGVAQTIGSTTYSPNVMYAYFEWDRAISKWKRIGSKSAAEVAVYRKWNIITFQQNGNDNHRDYNTYYKPFCDLTFKTLATIISNPIKIGWLLTHGSYCSTKATGLANWEGSAENTQKVMNETAAEVLFPYGTAIQNLRTTSIATSGDYGALLQADTAHLQEGIATLCAAYCMVLRILQIMNQGKTGIIGESTRPTNDWENTYNIPGPNYAEAGVVEGISDTNCYLAQVAAIKAIQNPYEVTDLSQI